MITLYKMDEDPAGQEIQDALRELCLAHEVVRVAACGGGRGSLPEGTQLPALVDEGKVYQDRNSILAHLEELRALRELWYKYGGDACYCDDAGNVE